MRTLRLRVGLHAGHTSDCTITQTGQPQHVEHRTAAPDSAPGSGARSRLPVLVLVLCDHSAHGLGQPKATDLTKMMSRRAIMLRHTRSITIIHQYCWQAEPSFAIGAGQLAGKHVLYPRLCARQGSPQQRLQWVESIILIENSVL